MLQHLVADVVLLVGIQDSGASGLVEDKSIVLLVGDALNGAEDAVLDRLEEFGTVPFKVATGAEMLLLQVAYLLLFGAYLLLTTLLEILGQQVAFLLVIGPHRFKLCGFIGKLLLPVGDIAVEPLLCAGIIRQRLEHIVGVDHSIFLRHSHGGEA